MQGHAVEEQGGYLWKKGRRQTYFYSKKRHFVLKGNGVLMYSHKEGKKQKEEGLLVGATVEATAGQHHHSELAVLGGFTISYRSEMTGSERWMIAANRSLNCQADCGLAGCTICLAAKAHQRQCQTHEAQMRRGTEPVLATDIPVPPPGSIESIVDKARQAKAAALMRTESRRVHEAVARDNADKQEKKTRRTSASFEAHQLKWRSSSKGSTVKF
jgi:hypothetical protein